MVDWPSSIEYQWARQRRQAVKAGGGVLDLTLPLRVTGESPPLFCAPPVMGLSWCYSALLKHIDEAYPVYGLQSRGLRQPEPLPADIGELARDFADEIRRTQPSGPYHLLGWSLGGMVAMAIAEELERRGEEVAMLVVLDAYPHAPSMNHPDQVWLLYDIVLLDLGYPATLVEGDQRLESRVLEIVRATPGHMLDDWTDARIMAMLRVIRNNTAITAAYRPQRIRTTLQLIAATMSPPHLSRKLDAWEPYIDGPICSATVDCRHQHMMLPDIAEEIGRVVTDRLHAMHSGRISEAI